VIDFTAQLFGLDALGAVKKLNTDFALNLPLDHHEPTREERQAAQRRAELTDAYNSFEAWRADFICKLNAVFRMAHQMDVTDLDKLIDREAVALQIQAEVEYLADLLEGGTPEQQAKIYRERREYEWIGSLLKG
jgi:hypothetical protein